MQRQMRKGGEIKLLPKNESRKEKYVKLKSLDDLVKIVASSPVAFFQHFEFEGKHIYFVDVMFSDGGSLIYYVKRADRIDSKYVVFNVISGKVWFSETVTTDANLKYIPIIEIEKQNILSREVLES